MFVVLGDDFRYMDPQYVGSELRVFPDGSKEGYFGERYKYLAFDGGKYLESVYMTCADIHELKDLDRSRFPHADWFEYKNRKAQAKKFHDTGYIVCAGTAGDMDFINGISRAKGMEQVLMDMIDDNAVFLEIMVCRPQRNRKHRYGIISHMEHMIRG